METAICCITVILIIRDIYKLCKYHNKYVHHNIFKQVYCIRFIIHYQVLQIDNYWFLIYLVNYGCTIFFLNNVDVLIAFNRERILILSLCFSQIENGFLSCLDYIAVILLKRTWNPITLFTFCCSFTSFTLPMRKKIIFGVFHNVWL